MARSACDWNIGRMTKEGNVKRRNEDVEAVVERAAREMIAKLRESVCPNVIICQRGVTESQTARKRKRETQS